MTVNLPDILDRPIAFQRSFVTITKSITAALMLSQACYWSKRTGEDGWFFKTRDEWEDETGLSRYEQEGARKILLRLGIMEEKRQGVPCRIYFKVNVEQLLLMLPRLGGGKTPIQSGENPPTSRGKTDHLLITETTSKNTSENTKEDVESFALDPPPAGDLLFEVDDLPRRVKEGWNYFLEQTGKSSTQYVFSQQRQKQGLKAFESLVAYAKRARAPDPHDTASELFQIAVDRLSESKFHNGDNPSGTKYLDWNQLFTGKNHPFPTKLVEYWLDDSRFKE
jgi:hypothetical protein